MSKDFGSRLKEERTRFGITQAELGQRVEFSRRTINSVENGIFIPSTLLALRLAKALECKVEDLFFIPPEDG